MIYSFAHKVKEEICGVKNQRPCCEAAQLLGIILFAGKVAKSSIEIITENEHTFQTACELFSSIFGINAETKSEGGHYSILVCDGAEAEQILLALKLIERDNRGLVKYRISDEIVREDCCKASFLRGVFLGGGTVITPEKNYHLEMISRYFKLGEDLRSLLFSIGFPFKQTVRKSHYVIYAKDSEYIVDFLTFLGAHKAVMEIINIKIERELRNDLNRFVNCESANLDKTIGASMRMISTIQKIDKIIGINNLDGDLREVASLRQQHSDISLTELGKMIDPPLTKSGVSHRLKKISRIAERL